VSTLKVIDLFCGCGGMSLGFHYLNTPNSLIPENIGLPVLSDIDVSSVWANDFNQHAIATFAENFQIGNQAHSGRIESLIENKHRFPHANVVIGGPPCQGFSLLNKNKTDDARRELWWHYLEVVARSGASVLVMENVPQLLDGDEYHAIAKRIKELGFRHMMSGVVCAANYGVPQTRRRAIIMAAKKHPICLPLPTHLPGGSQPDLADLRLGRMRPWRTVRDAIGDLPKKTIGTEIGNNPADPLSLHFGRTPTALSEQRYRAVPAGGNRFDLQRNAPTLTPQCWIRKTSGGTDLFGRLWWDRPSVTIRTEFFKPEKGRYLHPSEHRPISHREAARIQSFPDSFVFRGSKTEIAKQIGNAVPPILAYHLAYEVAMSLAGRRTTSDMARAARVLQRIPQSDIKEMWNAQTKPGS
jgi:DNA (cytosine-5)-methyltransferase 1